MPPVATSQKSRCRLYQIPRHARGCRSFLSCPPAVVSPPNKRAIGAEGAAAAFYPCACKKKSPPLPRPGFLNLRKSARTWATVSRSDPGRDFAPPLPGLIRQEDCRGQRQGAAGGQGVIYTPPPIMSPQRNGRKYFVFFRKKIALTAP